MGHAWNADTVVSNSLLANLQRSSDHHIRLEAVRRAAGLPISHSCPQATRRLPAGSHPAGVVCADGPAAQRGRISIRCMT